MNSMIRTKACLLALATTMLLASQTFAQDAEPALGAASTASQSVSTSEKEANKRVAVSFYNLALNEKNSSAAMKYVSDNFKQHSVLVGDGYAGLQKFLDWVRTEQPKLHANINRVFADGDYVILDVLMIRHPGDRGLAIAEIYRLKDGKLVEHWDRIQEIPEKSKNSNGMF